MFNQQYLFLIKLIYTSMYLFTILRLYKFKKKYSKNDTDNSYYIVYLCANNIWANGCKYVMHCNTCDYTI